MVGIARTWLFAPGSRPERFAKAAAAGADEVILDLEDSVAAPAKATAREAVARWLNAGGATWVRINAADTPWHDDDIDALRNCSGLRGLVVPKAEDPDRLGAVAQRLTPGTPLMALVESAAGVLAAPAIAASPSVGRLAFGSLDFALDIDAAPTDDALLHARGALVLAARAAGLPGPVDGVTTDVGDPKIAGREAARARWLGFGGKLCIHPRQLAAVTAAFAPSAAELDWARSILAGAGEGAFAHDGQMVDAPILERARRIAARAGA